MEFMMPLAIYYFPLHLFLVLILTISQYNTIARCQRYTIIDNRYSYRPLVAYSIFFILLYGLRPITSIFGDTVNYAGTYSYLQDYGVYNIKGDEKMDKDFIFYILIRLCSQTIDVHLFFVICLFLYVVLMFAGCKKLDYKHGAIIMLFCFGSFEFYVYAVNGVRNGIACSFVILALAYMCKNKKLWAIVLSVIALGFHKSTIIPIVSMYISYYLKKPKYMFYVWLVALPISLFLGSYIDNLLVMLNYDQRLADNLLKNDADGMSGEHLFRWDFLLYSIMPILLGWYTIYKRKFYNNTYLVLLGTYIYANAIWVLAIRALFSNRIAYLSWFIYPIVLAYPLLNFPVFKKNHCEKTAWILLGHFSFTLILWLLGKL